jgi:hypothetical protein
MALPLPALLYIPPVSPTRFSGPEGSVTTVASTRYSVPKGDVTATRFSVPESSVTAVTVSYVGLFALPFFLRVDYERFLSASVNSAKGLHCGVSIQGPQCALIKLAPSYCLNAL